MGEKSQQIPWMAVPEDLYRADFELLTKYQAFSAELLRIALLGIGVFGFLLTKGLLSVGNSEGWMIASIACFALACIAALIHRYASTESMHQHVLAIRREQGQDARQAAARKGRKVAYRWSSWSLGFGCVFLGLGAVLLATAFILHGDPDPPAKSNKQVEATR